MRNLNSTAVDIGKRYHPASYNHDLIHNGSQATELLKPEYTADYLGYDRPYFNCPDLSGPDGNIFALLQVFEECLKKNGYTSEYKEFSMSTTLSNRYEDIINKMALFVDMEIVIKTVTVDGEEFKKVKQTPAELQNPKEFNIKTVKEFNELITNGFDITTQNAYGRTLLHYTNSPLLITEILKHNDLLESKGEPHINLFSLDNFNATYLHNRKTFGAYNLIFEYMSKKNEPMLEMFTTGRDVFNNNSISSLTILFSQVFENKESVKEHLPKMLATLKLLQTADPVYVDKMREEIFSEKFINEMAKRASVTPENILSVIKESQIKFNHSEIEASLPVKESTVTKKRKI